PSANVSERGHRRDPAGRRTSSPVSARRLSTAAARPDGQEMPVVLCPSPPVCPLDATVARPWRNRLGLQVDARGVKRARLPSANEVCDRDRLLIPPFAWACFGMVWEQNGSN